MILVDATVAARADCGEHHCASDVGCLDGGSAGGIVRAMDVRVRGGWALVLSCLALVGCASSTVGQRVAPSRPRAPSLTTAHRCAQDARLTPGVAFPGWHMGAVQFFSATSGVGVTAENFPCYRPIKGGGAEVGLQRQAVRGAITNDGGHSWEVVGAPVPVGRVSGGVVADQIVATSPSDLWAVVGKGRLVATHDGGADWHVQRLPNPVVQVTAGAGFVWATSCAHVASPFPFACRPRLWRTRSANGRWTQVALPRVTAQASFFVRFAITANGDAIIQVIRAGGGRSGGELFTSRNGGAPWTRRPDPSWDHHTCDDGSGDMLVAGPAHSFWLLCIANAAAGSSTKGLLQSTDAGLTWRTISAAPSLTQRPRPGSLPLEEPSALAVGSPTRLWLSLTNDLAESNDGGHRWTSVSGVVNTGGYASVLDVLSTSHAWLLAPGAGLWRTTNGQHWSPVGPLNTR